MRFRHVIAIVVVAVAGSLAGKEEPLPVVTPLAGAPQIEFGDPILDPPKPTLSGAAHANDFATFDALYRDAQRRGENVAAYATLHDLWSWSVNDPIGAFYGQTMHDRLARTYPGYAAFIEDQRVVDNHGTAFYPTSETRAFLLARAESGVAAPAQVRVAETRHQQQPAAPKAAKRAPRVARHAAPVKVASAPAEKAPAPAPKPAPAPAPVKAAPIVAPVTKAAHPIDVAKPEPAPVKAAPFVAPIEKTIAPPVEVAKPAPAPAATPARTPAKAAEKSGADRGLLLVIVGLIGIGLLALILRAPREEVPSVLPPTAPPPGPDHP